VSALDITALVNQTSAVGTFADTEIKSILELLELAGSPSTIELKVEGFGKAELSVLFFYRDKHGISLMLCYEKGDERYLFDFSLRDVNVDNDSYGYSRLAFLLYYDKSTHEWSLVHGLRPKREPIAA
jgi:hypothetical protein